MNDIATTRSCRPAVNAGIDGVQRSFSYATRSTVSTSGTGRHIKYGDRIHVRLSRVQPGGEVLADFVLDNVNDMSDVYGELRFYTRGKRGLTTLYVRNIKRGWSFSQPFMLYDDFHRPAVAVGRQAHQPVYVSERGSVPPARPAETVRKPTGRREIPESIRLLFGEH